MHYVDVWKSAEHFFGRQVIVDADITASAKQDGFFSKKKKKKKERNARNSQIYKAASQPFMKLFRWIGKHARTCRRILSPGFAWTQVISSRLFQVRSTIDTRFKANANSPMRFLVSADHDITAKTICWLHLPLSRRCSALEKVGTEHGDISGKRT